MPHELPIEEHPRNAGYDPATFRRFQSLQAQGPEGMRRFAKVLWRCLETEDQISYIHEAIDVVGLEGNAQALQDAHINMRLVTEYMVRAADPRHHFHRVDVRSD